MFKSKFDVIFSIGVFERLNEEKVSEYLGKMRKLLDDHGTMLIYFLSERAKETEFVKRLGKEAYVYWNIDKIVKISSGKGLKLIDCFEWDTSYSKDKKTVSIADMCVFKIES